MGFGKRAAALAAILVLAGATATGVEEKSAQPKKVAYKTVGDVALYLHLFEPETHPKGEKAPAIVFFFGGGWVGGTPSQFYPHCRHYAEKGFVAMAAEYRVKNRHGTTPFECVADGKSAVRWTRMHAAELGADPNRIVSGGGSAGGHVAACTGVIQGLDEEGEDSSVSSRPNAMVLFNPVVDTTAKGYGAKKLAGREKAVSPAHHVRKGLPPAIIFHGAADTTVPIENVERFTRLMKEAGNVCELVRFEGKSHGFFNYKRDKAAYWETIRKADAFLNEVGITGDGL